MKNLILITLFSLMSSVLIGQDPGYYPSGLLYSDTAIVKLSRIVDSLHREFDLLPSDAVYYVVNELDKPEPIPQKYARMIQYKDFLLSTGTYMYDTENGIRMRDIARPADLAKPVAAFMNYVSEVTQKPKFDGIGGEAYAKKWRYWDSTRYLILDELFLKEEQPKIRLENAVNAVLNGGNSNDNFDEYISRYYSKKTALHIKRTTGLMGDCGYDIQYHYMNIATLAAESATWSPFLSTHLNILNRKYKRTGELSWRRNRRFRTYINELDAIGLNVPYLLLGYALSTQNGNKEDYLEGGIVKAMAESKHSDEIGESILSMIADEELDDRNRISMYYLFRNYNVYVDNQEKKMENLVKLKKAVAKLPAYLQDKTNVVIPRGTNKYTLVEWH